MTELEKLKELVKVQDEYIALLGNEVEKSASFLINHHWVFSQESIDHGKNLRNKIKELKES